MEIQTPLLKIWGWNNEVRRWRVCEHVEFETMNEAGVSAQVWNEGKVSAEIKVYI